MVDLTELLLEAERCDRSWSKDRLRSLLNDKEGITFDWDMECGERWATVFFDQKFIGYVSSVLPLAFCKTAFLKEIERTLEEKVLIIGEDDLDSKKWFIDPQKLAEHSKRLRWIVNEQVLELKQFSINDLWYATI